MICEILLNLGAAILPPLVKKRLLAALLAGASLAAHAQTYYLDLTGQLLNVPNRTVALDQVLDGRPGDPPIGIVYRGLNGKSAAVAFEKGPAVELTAWAKLQLLPKPTDHLVVLCLRSLHITETPTGTARQQATAELTADVYEHLPTGYHFVQSVSAHASDSGLKTTGYHAGHVAQVLSQCILQLNRADWPAVAARPARTLAELPTDVPAILAGNRRGPAILREVPRRGLYHQFDQFLANRPDTTSVFAVDTFQRKYKSELAAARWLGVARVQLLAPAKAGNALNELWGFSDGRQAFVRYRGMFFPLMRQGTFFTFVGEAPLDPVHVAANAQSNKQAVVYGLIGGAIAQNNVADHTGEPMAFALDLHTGALEAYPGLHTPLRHDTAYVYAYRMPQPGSSPTISVTVDGRAMGSLQPGQYLEVPYARFGKPLKICFIGARVANPCQVFVPNTAQLNYLRLNASTAPQPWQWMPPKQASADLDELDKQAKP